MHVQVAHYLDAPLQPWAHAFWALGGLAALSSARPAASTGCKSHEPALIDYMHADLAAALAAHRPGAAGSFLAVTLTPGASAEQVAAADSEAGDVEPALRVSVGPATSAAGELRALEILYTRPEAVDAIACEVTADTPSGGAAALRAGSTLLASVAARAGYAAQPSFTRLAVSAPAGSLFEMLPALERIVQHGAHTLTELCFERFEMDRSDAAELAAIVTAERMPALRALRLTHSCLLGSGARSLSHKLERCCSALTALTISSAVLAVPVRSDAEDWSVMYGYAAPCVSFKRLLSSVMQLPNLHALDLSSVRNIGVCVPLAQLGALTALTRLNLSRIATAGQWHNRDQLRRWLELTPPQQLRYLDLSHNELDDDQAHLVSASLSAMPSLEHLDLSHNSFERHSRWSQIAPQPFMRRRDNALMQLTCLKLHGTSGLVLRVPNATGFDPPWHEGVAAEYSHARLRAAFDALPSLQHFSGAADARALAAIAHHVPTCLTYLDLSRSRLAPAVGCVALAVVLARMPALHNLHLSHCRLGASGFAEVATMLPRLSRLRSLALQGNALGSTGITALARHLPALSALTALDAGASGICGSEAGVMLAKALSSLPCLQRLYVPNCVFSGQGADAMTEYVLTTQAKVRGPCKQGR